jgi:D-alanyl-D-alanine carboxypeptidase (penicillin-binding protein 5/6)
MGLFCLTLKKEGISPCLSHINVPMIWTGEYKMKKIGISFLLFLLIISSLQQISFASPPEISAQAAVLIDVSSGRILYAKEPDARLPIASLTKIMTAIVAIEHGDLNDMVKASKNAVGVEGSSIYLRLGEELSLEDLLYGLMLRSGNDAAVAIAEHVGGSVEGFVYMMNEKARILGLENTHFMNPHGLDHPEHYSSARDLAILTAYALKNPTFKKIVSTQVKTAPLADEEWDRKWFNKNKMLRMYQGADGVKTGYTRLAKRCLVSSATRNERQLAVVVINDGNDWNDSARLMDYGFQEYQLVELVHKGQSVEDPVENRKIKLEFVTTRESKYPLMEGELGSINSKVVLIEENMRKGVLPAGYLQLFLGNTLIDQVPLKAIKSAETSAKLETNEAKTTLLEKWEMFWLALF